MGPAVVKQTLPPPVPAMQLGIGRDNGPSQFTGPIEIARLSALDVSQDQAAIVEGCAVGVSEPFGHA